MNAVDLNHIILENVPVCPVCGDYVGLNDDWDLATYNGTLFIIHYECGDVEYCDA